MNNRNKTICGVGINDSDYVTSKFEDWYVNGKRKQRLLWVCPYYQKWTSMIKRCYSKSYQNRYPAYKGCVVCEEWKRFSNFKAWMETQDWEGKQLDKDLLGSGKLYSPENCCFISKKVNQFMIDQKTRRGVWPIGVYWNKRDECFKSQIRNPFTSKNENLGEFITAEAAYLAWKQRKKELCLLLCNEIEDKRVSDALKEKYS